MIERGEAEVLVVGVRVVLVVAVDDPDFAADKEADCEGDVDKEAEFERLMDGEFENESDAVGDGDER